MTPSPTPLAAVIAGAMSLDLHGHLLEQFLAQGRHKEAAKKREEIAAIHASLSAAAKQVGKLAERNERLAFQNSLLAEAIANLRPPNAPPGGQCQTEMPQYRDAIHGGAMKIQPPPGVRIINNAKEATAFFAGEPPPGVPDEVGVIAPDQMYVVGCGWRVSGSTLLQLAHAEFDRLFPPDEPDELDPAHLAGEGE